MRSAAVTAGLLILLMVSGGVAVSVNPVDAEVVEPTPAVGVNRSFGIYGDSVVSAAGKSWILWYDHDLHPGTWVTERDEEDGLWTEPVFLGRSQDDHGHTDIAVGPDGHLHVVYGGHANRDFPMSYRRSIEPYDASAWSEPAVVTMDAGSSYPQFAVSPSGDIVMVYREGGSNGGDLMFRRVSAEGNLGRPVELADVSGHSVYPDDLRFDADGDLHVTYTIRAGAHDPYGFDQRPWIAIAYATLPAPDPDQPGWLDPEKRAAIGGDRFWNRLGGFAGVFWDAFDADDRFWETKEGDMLTAPWDESMDPIIETGEPYRRNPHPQMIDPDSDALGILYDRSPGDEVRGEDKGKYLMRWDGDGWVTDRLARGTTLSSATSVDGRWTIVGGSPGDGRSVGLYWSDDQGDTWDWRQLAVADFEVDGAYMDDGAGTMHGPAPDGVLRGVIIPLQEAVGADLWYFEEELPA